jgi:hypothetical protein
MDCSCSAAGTWFSFSSSSDFSSSSSSDRSGSGTAFGAGDRACMLSLAFGDDFAGATRLGISSSESDSSDEISRGGGCFFGGASMSVWLFLDVILAGGEIFLTVSWVDCFFCGGLTLVGRVGVMLRSELCRLTTD